MLALVYLTHLDIYGTKSHPQTLRKILRTLGRASVLSNLAVVNNIYAHSDFLGRGHEDFPKIQDLLKRSYLRTEIRHEITRNNLSDRLVFLRLQNLYLAQLCILHSDDLKPVIADGETEGGYKLGDCLLMVGDHLLSAEEAKKTSTGSDETRIRHLGFQIAPSSEISNPLDMLRGIVRSEIIYSDILDSAELREAAGDSKLKKLDLASRFAKTVGISLSEYIDITVALLSYLLVPDKNGELNIIRPIEVKPFLAKSRLRQAALESYLALESSTVEELREKFKSQPRYLNKFSFLPFKAHPVIEIQKGLYFCIDSHFLSEKLNAGLYWKIFDNLPGNCRSDFSEVYGHIFEIYARRLLRGVLNHPRIDPKKGFLFSDPRYANGDQSFDELIYYPDTKHLIVIETKGSFMNTTAKFGRSIVRFWKEIKQKYIETEKGEAKGIGQLVKHIGNLFAEEKSIRRHISDDSLDRWIQAAEKITPILIVQEPVICFHIHEYYLNNEFNKKLKKLRLRAGVNVANLAVINIETLEKLKPHLINNEVTLEQCLNYRNYRDSEYRSDFASLTYENFNLRDQTDDETNKVHSAVFKRVMGRLFNADDSSIMQRLNQ